MTKRSSETPTGMARFPYNIAPPGFAVLYFAPLSLSVALTAWFGFGFWSIAIGLAVFGMAMLVWKLVNRWHIYAAEISADGITIRKRSRRKEKVLYRSWTEVSCIKPARLFGIFSRPNLVIQIKPKRFLSWNFGARRRLFVPWVIWRRRAFLLNLKTYAPPEKVAPIVQQISIPQDEPWRRRFISFCLLVSGAIATFQVILSPYHLSTSMIPTEILVIISAIMSVVLLTDYSLLRRRVTLIVWPIVHMSLLLPQNRFFFFLFGLPALWIGLIAAFGVWNFCGAGIMLIRPRRVPRWIPTVVYAMVISSFFAGWKGYGGVQAVELRQREMFIANPWTPDGNMFFLTESDPIHLLDSQETTEQTGVSISWYRANGTLVREDIPDTDAQSVLILLSSEIAGLARTNVNEKQKLWYLPVSDAPKELIQADSIPTRSFRCSPNRRWAAAMAYWEDNDPNIYTTQWYRIDMNNGAIKLIDAPHLQNEIEAVAVNDDGALFWLQGRNACPHEERDYRPGQGIPRLTEFAEPGIPFSIWYDDPSDEEAARPIYTETNVWLDLATGGNLQNIHAIRAVAEPEPHVEYICLTREGMEVETATLPESEYEKSLPNGSWRGEIQPLYNGPVTTSNGQYRLEVEDPWKRLWLTNLKTGERRYLRRSPLPMSGYTLAKFSPNNRYVLIGTIRLRQNPWRPFFCGGTTAEMGIILIDLESLFKSDAVVTTNLEH